MKILDRTKDFSIFRDFLGKKIGEMEVIIYIDFVAAKSDATNQPTQ
jgi:hypothetical protein